MVILVGLILLALGLSLVIGQGVSFLIVLRSVLALGLMFWGTIAVLVGYSEMKARHEYKEAVHNDSNDSAPAPTQPAQTEASNTADATLNS